MKEERSNRICGVLGFIRASGCGEIPSFGRDKKRVAAVGMCASTANLKVPFGRHSDEVE